MESHQSTVSLLIKSYRIFLIGRQQPCEKTSYSTHLLGSIAGSVVCVRLCVSLPYICAVCVSLWCVSVSYVCVHLSHACMHVCVCLCMHMSLFHVSVSLPYVYISHAFVCLSHVFVWQYTFVWLCACTIHSAMCMCVCMTVGACILQARMVMRNGKSVKTTENKASSYAWPVTVAAPSSKVSTVYFYSLLPVQLHSTFPCTVTQYIFTD